MTIRNLAYILTCLAFSLICGAAVYEHTALWPKAFAKLPASLSAFQGDYGLDSGIFWMTIHPITLTFFIITTIISWRTERRKFVLYPLLGYLLVLTVTFIYFVPELLDLVNTPFSNTYDEGRTSRASLWVTLSIIRGVFLFVIAVMLYLGLTRPAVKTAGTLSAAESAPSPVASPAFQ